MLMKQVVGCIGTFVVVETDGRALTDAEFGVLTRKKFDAILSRMNIQQLLKAKRKRWFAEGPSENAFDWRAYLRGPDNDAA